MSTMMLARGAVLAVATATLMAGAASAEVFMKAPGATGEATAKGFEQQVVLTGASFSISSYPGFDAEGLPSGRLTSVGPVLLTKSPDRSSPRLALAAVEGAPLGTVEITFTEPAARGRPGEVKARWILEGASVRAFSVYPGATPGEGPIESIELAYATMRYQVPGASQSGVSEEVQWTAPEDQMSLGHPEGCG
jgi:type VI protein secretion system component Hcp